MIRKSLDHLLFLLLVMVYMYEIQCVSLSVSMNQIVNWTNCYALVLVQKCYKVWMRHNKNAEIKNCVFNKLQSTLTFSQNGKPVELFSCKYCWRTKIINFLIFVFWRFVCLQECYCFVLFLVPVFLMLCFLGILTHTKFMNFINFVLNAFCCWLSQNLYFL